MDIIEANKCLWYGYRPPLKGIFNNKDIGRAEGKKQEAELLLKEQAKAYLTATVTIEAATEATTQEEDAAADKEALAMEEEEAIKHSSKVEDKEREGSKVEGELPNIN